MVGFGLGSRANGAVCEWLESGHIPRRVAQPTKAQTQNKKSSQPSQQKPKRLKQSVFREFRSKRAVARVFTAQAAIN
jgi:hypothetical protein